MSIIHKLPPLGLTNEGLNCYFNAFLQLLYTCDIYESMENIYEDTCINDTINGDFKKLPKALEYKKKILEYLITYAAELQLFYDDKPNISTNDGIPDDKISGYILEKFRNLSSISKEYSTGQNDPTEILYSLLEFTGLEINFRIYKYENVICEKQNKSIIKFDQIVAKDIEIKVHIRLLNEKVTEAELVTLLLNTDSGIIPDAKCSICGGTNCVRMISTPFLLPNNLLLFLGRYKADMVKKKVEFPPLINIYSKFGYKYVYELSASVQHSGGYANIAKTGQSTGTYISSTGGHYTCLVKRNLLVFDCDDSRARQLNATELKTDEHSLLILYKKIHEEFNKDYIVDDNNIVNYYYKNN